MNDYEWNSLLINNIYFERMNLRVYLLLSIFVSRLSPAIRVYT